MGNMFMILGRVVEILENNIVINVKNENGFFLVKLDFTEDFIKNIKSYINKNDLIATKGHIETINNNIKLIVEKVSMLSHEKEED